MGLVRLLQFSLAALQVMAAGLATAAENVRSYLQQVEEGGGGRRRVRRRIVRQRRTHYCVPVGKPLAKLYVRDLKISLGSLIK